MLDTVALTLERRQFEIVDCERFSPSARGLMQPPFYRLGARGNFSCVLNPTQADYEAGRYRPRLTLTKRKAQAGFSLKLRIEFSAPKLLFGNNFDELRTCDFERVLDALHRELSGMGVRVDRATLRRAPVSAIHYSKNIAFTDYTTCSMVMNELGRINLSQRLDLSHTDYRNEGHAIRYHTNSYEVTFYDKIRDLQKARVSEKRAFEKDYGAQIDFFTKPNGFPKQLEVLRMEVRLSNRTKIRALLKQLGIREKPQFDALFSADIAQRILLHFWEAVRRQLPLVCDAKIPRPEEILQGLVTASGGITRPGKLLQQVGGILLVRAIGVRGLGALLRPHCSPRTWQRAKRELSRLKVADGGTFSALKGIDAILRDFQPVRLKDFQIGTS